MPTFPFHFASSHERPSGSPSPRRWPPRDGRTRRSPRSPANADEASRQAIARALDESYPDRPEWVDMLADILQGSQLGPNDGWFRRAVAQTRFGWEETRERLDRDGDGRIDREEFPGSDPDFARLDRDHDRMLTETDFDFSPHALTPSPGAMMFYRADGDSNGKVTREELDGFFKACDSGGQGFLSLSDLQEAFRAPTRPAAVAKAPSGPSKETLVRGLFRQEIGSLQPGPALGEPAPDFTLKTQRRRGRVDALEARRAEAGRARLRQLHLRPVPQPGRQRREAVPPLQGPGDVRHGLRARGPPDRRLADGEQRPRRRSRSTSRARTRSGSRVAQACDARLNLGFPMLVDTIDDTVGARYSGMPSRLYLIDARRQGRLQERPRPVRVQAGRAGALARAAAPARGAVRLDTAAARTRDGLDAPAAR